MILINYHTAPYFHDKPAAEIQDWFTAADSSYGVALQAFLGRGVYEGLRLADQSGYDQYEDFSFELEKDSLREYMEKVEKSRHTFQEEEKVFAKVTNMVATVSYMDEGPSPILWDVPHLDDLLAMMKLSGICPEWFAWISVKDGKVENLVSAEEQDRKAPEDVLEIAQLMYDGLNQRFESLMKRAGHHALDGVIVIGADPGYDFNDYEYNDSEKAIYDDQRNLAIIQCQLIR